MILRDLTPCDSAHCNTPQVRVQVPAFDELTVAPHGADVRRASDWLDAVCPPRGVPLANVDRLLVSLNEVLANVIAHSGAAAKSSPVGLRLDVVCHANGGQASVTVSDTGRPFNPLTVAPSQPAKTLDQATAGGRGLLMIHHFSDWLSYDHVDGRNQFTFGVRWGQM